MLSKNHFYWNSIKNYIVGMYHIFDDIHVLRKNDAGDTISDIKVPITFASKTKLFYKLQRDDERNLSTILPRISFILGPMVRDSSRSTSYSNTITYTNDGDIEEFQYNPIPYNFEFTASIWSKYIDDIMQMVEQICSFFDPDFTITINEIPSLGITKDISILLDGVELNIDNEFEDDDRILTADFTFTLKGYIYKPISENKIITHILANIRNDNTDAKETIETIDHIWNTITEEIDSDIITP